MQLCWNFKFFWFKSRELFVLSALLEEIDKKSAEHKRKLLLDRPSWLSLSWTQMNHVLLLPYLSGTENILSELNATWSRDCWREGKERVERQREEEVVTTTGNCYCYFQSHSSLLIAFISTALCTQELRHKRLKYQ